MKSNGPCGGGTARAVVEGRLVLDDGEAFVRMKAEVERQVWVSSRHLAGPGDTGVMRLL
jgi:hypothetical protein